MKTCKRKLSNTWSTKLVKRNSVINLRSLLVFLLALNNFCLKKYRWRVHVAFLFAKRQNLSQKSIFSISRLERVKFGLIPSE